METKVDPPRGEMEEAQKHQEHVLSQQNTPKAAKEVKLLLLAVNPRDHFRKHWVGSDIRHQVTLISLSLPFGNITRRKRSTGRQS